MGVTQYLLFVIGLSLSRGLLALSKVKFSQSVFFLLVIVVANLTDNVVTVFTVLYKDEAGLACGFIQQNVKRTAG